MFAHSKVEEEEKVPAEFAHPQITYPWTVYSLIALVQQAEILCEDHLSLFLSIPHI